MRLWKIALLLLFCCGGGEVFSLGVIINFNRFNTQDNMPYAEFYISVVGKSIRYQKKADGLYQGSVEFLFLIKNATNNAVVYADKFNLLSPNLKDTTHLREDFYFTDVKRIELPNGKYKLEIQSKDNNKPSDIQKVTSDFEIDFNPKEVRFSDISFLSTFHKTTTKNKFSKAGYDMYPQPNAMYGDNMDTLAFYAELYGITNKVPKDDPILITISIGSRGSNKILEKYVHRVKKTATDAPIVILDRFPIADLISQSYFLSCIVQDKSGNVVAQTNVGFYRHSTRADRLFAEKNLAKSVNLSEDNIINSYSEKDLDMYIDALGYISDEAEVAYAKSLSNIDEKRKFLYNFWLKRNDNDPIKSMRAWLEYKQRIDLVNEKYKSQLRKGYLTDRGRVALTYGLPNDIQVVPRENNTYPHEIWYYYKLNGQANVRFIFYDKDYTTNDLRLLHSDLYGELQNSRWEAVLRGKTVNPNLNTDNNILPGNYGSNYPIVPRRPDEQ
ncbi:MAG: GWxTD domain-containing protein [Bacteroidia bacterium]|nr:GWxTD domain-containing protein [Bacteroidia bacterium]